jgi:hypothetical protein
MARWPTHSASQSTNRQKSCRCDFSGADDGLCFDKQTKQWVTCEVDFGRAIMTPIDGLILPIINRADLIAYKTALAREVDLLDVAALKAGSANR